MNTMIVAADAINVAQGGITAQSGEGLKNVLLGIIGSLLLIVVGGRMLAALTEERYGKMLSLIAGGAAVALFAYMPDVGVGILKGFASMVTGGGAA